MDTDLFQLVAVALLFLCFLALLAALSILSGIKNQLASRPANDSSSPAQSTYEYQAPTASYEPASTYSEPAPQVQAQEVSTGFVPMAELTPAAEPLTSEPVGSSSIPGGLRGDEPEEQPFERDGRWWFKRGGELLVYDEGTGQWVASGATGASAGAATGSTGTLTPVATQADVGEGWKCSSCGAVNGSTATSCRMCFAPR